MLEIARGILFTPKLMLLDEPSAGISPKLTNLIYDKLLQLNKEHGITLLIVEQNVYKTLQVCGEIYVLELGRNKYRGRAGDPKTHEIILRSYLA